MAKLRTCLVCGAKYKYCNTCGDYNPEETWRFLFDNEKCYDIYKIWQQYHSEELPKDGFKNALKGFNLAVVLSEDTNTMISSDIKNVFLDVKEDIEPSKEVVVEQPRKIESVKKAEEFMNVGKKFNSNKNDTNKRDK